MNRIKTTLRGALAACVLGITPAAFAQFPKSIVALEGQQDAITGGTYSSFGLTASGAGAVFFEGTLATGGSVNSSNNEVLFLSSGTQRQMVMREGAIVAGGTIKGFEHVDAQLFQSAVDNEGNIAYRVQTTTGTNILLSGTNIVVQKGAAVTSGSGSYGTIHPFAFAAGRMVFDCEITGAETNAEAIFSYAPSTGLKKLVRTKEPVPASAGGLSGTFGNLSDRPHLSEDGKLVFCSDIGTLFKRVVYTGTIDSSTGELTPNSLTAQVWEGQFIPASTEGYSGQKFSHLFGVPVNNSRNTIAFKVQLTAGTSSSPLDGNEALWIKLDGADPKLVVYEGLVIDHSRCADVPAGESWVLDNIGDHNEQGRFCYMLAENDDIVFRAQLSSNGTQNVNSLWRYCTSTGELQLLVHEGQVNSARTTEQNPVLIKTGTNNPGLASNEIAMNRDGAVAFVTTSTDGKEDLWLHNGEELWRVAWQDETFSAPEGNFTIGANLSIADYANPAYGVNDSGRNLTDDYGFVFTAELTATGSSTPILNALIQVSTARSSTEIVAIETDAVPGHGQYGTFKWPTVNEHSTGLFETKITGSGVSSDTNEIYVRTRANGSPEVLFREGPVTGNSSAAAVVLSGTAYAGQFAGATFRSPEDYGMSDLSLGYNDTVCFTSFLVPGVGGITSANNGLIFVDNGTTLGLAVREGDPVPDGNGSIDEMATSTFKYVFNDGDLVFRSAITGQIPYTGGAALFCKYADKPLAMFARATHPVNSGSVSVPTFNGVTYSDFGLPMGLNRVRGVAYYATLSGSGITPANNKALLAGQLDSDGHLSSLRLVSQRGDAPVDSQGQPILGPNESIADYTRCSINDRGDVLWTSKLQLSGTLLSQDPLSLWFRASDAAQPRLVVRVGQQITVSGATFTVQGFPDEIPNDCYLQYNLAENGDVVFRARLTGTSISGTAHSIWRWKEASGELQLIAREGEVNPYRSLPVKNLRVGTSNTPNMGVNRNGDVLFITDVENTALDASLDLWIDENLPSGTDRRRRLLSEGEALPDYDNMVVLDMSLGGQNAPDTGVDSRGRVLSDSNEVVTKLTLRVDGAQTREAVVILHPEPVIAD